MTIAPLPNHETDRLAALRDLAILDTEPEPSFDDLTRLAATLCETPIALVSLVDASRQWFKSRHGLDATETARELAFCAHTILGDDLFEVPDATADERFADNLLVVGPPDIRFYAGAPLTLPCGQNVGTLCIIDTKPRTLTESHRDALRILARQVVAQLRLRQQLAELSHTVKRQETFRVLFEQSSDAHLIFDESDGILDCNHAAVEMLRCRDKSDVLALHPAVLSPEFQPDGRRSLEKCIEMDATARRDGFHRFDWTHRRANGEEFPCEVTLTPVDLHGRAVLLVVWHDLTDRKRAEDALRESEQRFRSVVDRLAEGVVLLDRDSRRVLRANPAFLAMLGYTADEMAALTQYDFVAHDPADIDANMAKVVARGQFHLGVRQYTRKDRELVHVTVSGSLLAVDGQPVLCLLVRDVTAEKRAADALRASEERFQAFMQYTPAMAYMKDESGRYQYVNEPVCRRFEKPLEDWLGRTDADFWSPDVAAELMRTDRRVLETGEMLQLREKVPTPDGLSELWQSYKFRFTDPAGRRYLAGMSVDVTAEARAMDSLRASEALLGSAFEDAAIGMALVSPDGRWLRVNRSVSAFLGYTPAELLTTDFQALTHPDDLNADLALVRQVLAGEVRAYHMEKRYFHKDGHTLYALLSVSLVRNAGGVPVYFVAQVQDIGPRKAAEEAVRGSELKFRLVVDRLAEGMFVVDPVCNRFVEVNTALLAILGYTADEFLALSLVDLVAGEPPEIVARNAAAIHDALARHGRHDLGRKHLRRKDGNFVPVEVRISLVPTGGAGLHAVIIRDMTEQVAAEERLFEYQLSLEDANAKLRALATTDGLTGIRNRAAFNERLTEECERAARFNRPLSLLLMDVDHFKMFNDTFGHPAGDEVLKTVARTLAATARITDFVARYGGEEFVVILPDTDIAGAMVVAERCRRAIAGVPWRERAVTVSIGVSTRTVDTTEPPVLVKQADEALYRSKSAGRNRVSHGSRAVPLTALTRIGTNG